MELTLNGQTLAVLPKTFKTGSRGYFGHGKAEVDGKRYQVTATIVEIGSKPTVTVQEPRKGKK